jgi:MFS family permease
MLILDAAVVQVALPHIRAELHFSPTNLLWVVNGYALPYGGMLLFGGRLGDVRGRFRIFQVGPTLHRLLISRLIYIQARRRPSSRVLRLMPGI